MAEEKKDPPESFLIHVFYSKANGTVSVTEGHVKINKKETQIQWVKASGSNDFKFVLDPSLKCPFGTPSLIAKGTIIDLHYHGKGSDNDLDFIYQLTVVPGHDQVEMSNGRVLGGSTIKNH